MVCSALTVMENGNGKGSITHPVYGAIPAYNDRVQIRRTGTTMSELKDGNLYHAITYGLNAMALTRLKLRQRRDGK